MKRNRDIAVEKINSMFGLSVTVEFSSSWDYRIKNGDNLTKNDFVDGGVNGENSDSETFENNSGDTETDSEIKEEKPE